MDYSGVSYSKLTLRSESLAEGAADGDGNVLKPSDDAPLVASVARRSAELWSDQGEDSPGLSEEARARALALAQASAQDPLAHPYLADDSLLMSEERLNVDDELEPDTDQQITSSMKKAARLGDFYRCLGNSIQARAIYVNWDTVGALFNSLRVGQADPLQEDRERLISMIRGFLSAGRIRHQRPAYVPEDDESTLQALCCASTAAGFFEAFAQVFYERAAWRDWGEFEPLILIYQKILKVQAASGFDPVTFAISNLRLFDARRCESCTIPRWGSSCKRCAVQSRASVST